MFLYPLKLIEMSAAQGGLTKSEYSHGLFLMHKADHCWCTKQKFNHVRWFSRRTTCCLCSAYGEFCKGKPSTDEMS